MSKVKFIGPTCVSVSQWLFDQKTAPFSSQEMCVTLVFHDDSSPILVCYFRGADIAEPPRFEHVPAGLGELADAQALKAFIFFTLIFVPAIAGAHGIELQLGC